MKLRTGICLPLSAILLLGCSSLNGEHQAEARSVLRVSNNADAEYQRGRQLHMMGNHLEAQSAYLSALSIDPSHAEARNGMAALIAANGDIDRAIGMLVKLSNDHPASHVYANLGYAYQLKGRDHEARDAYQRAVDMDPGNDGARARLEALDKKLQKTELVAAPADRASAELQQNQARIDNLGGGVYAMRYPTEPSPATAIAISTPTSTSAATTTAPQAETNLPVAVASPEPTTPGVVASSLPYTVSNAAAVPIELVNGNGVTGLARQLKSLLPGDEWRVVRTSNHRHFGVGVTRIDYAPMHGPDARHFADGIGLSPRLRLNPPQGGARLRIILGHDCKDIEQLKLRLAGGEPRPAS